uniref:Uncharacterized protein n=1 Tax=Chromera velia CCMP2878 TaxID=1169474 RepID=A0A0G4HXU8_9ALVE|mmetsp:Transcript_36965/g.72688  ORF Transcript_36965/g.72688 Transcript_36965/m.72688 type:complete len:257 (-) Transcript_36965:156-926(-)|eukprot:Cvel_9347.t1-p1 / transcript=Cvel_9347.t1 / gene=Cvel_9347 / organism=Chromera_velia_CCMP2878 / gene_product=hypothetical protein / transcript_product=hypothetical protein / location=Cvel_scaffold536:73971-76653(+) / protein_length=256 / sequence_SO=supercontig / SO=protein_coding / is_pseudo=false
MEAPSSSSLPSLTAVQAQRASESFSTLTDWLTRTAKEKIETANRLLLRPVPVDTCPSIERQIWQQTNRHVSGLSLFFCRDEVQSLISACPPEPKADLFKYYSVARMEPRMATLTFLLMSQIPLERLCTFLGIQTRISRSLCAVGFFTFAFQEMFPQVFWPSVHYAMFHTRMVCQHAASRVGSLFAGTSSSSKMPSGAIRQGGGDVSGDGSSLVMSCVGVGALVLLWLNRWQVPASLDELADNVSLRLGQLRDLFVG